MGDIWAMYFYCRYVCFLLLIFFYPHAGFAWQQQQVQAQPPVQTQLTPAWPPEKIILPYPGGRLVFCEAVRHSRLLKKTALLKQAVSWLNHSVPGRPAPAFITTDTLSNSQISGQGSFRVFTARAGDFYQLRFSFTISINDSSTTFTAGNIFEKPTVKGITNDWSKLEYRYWDYSNGKPWTADDQPLFTGLRSEMDSLSNSFERMMKATPAPGPRFRVLALYSTHVEDDHVDFARQAITFFLRQADKDNYTVDTTSDWGQLNSRKITNYQILIWLDDFPKTQSERLSFEHYMQAGGAWLGFHVAGYNDKDTHWPWFTHFLGGAVFFNNNWPPLAARMIVDNRHHPVTRHLPAEVIAPVNEWYGWKPDPRDNKDIRVLMTLDPANFPLGKKDMIRTGDIPVVWTNTKYKMLYMNMGHGDLNFSSAAQNQMFEDAVMWLGTGK